MTQNKHSDPQADRDRAARDKEQAQAGKASTVDGDRDAVDHAAKQGAGPAGLNTGPSDTISRDPHNPTSGQPLYRPGSDNRGDGMGMTPPKGAAPTSDRDPGRDPHAQRAAQSGSPEARAAADANAGDRQRMTDKEKDADRRLDRAGEKLADKQSPGPGDRDRRG